MDDVRPLSLAFLSAVSDDERRAIAADPSLETRLAAVVARARAAWPAVGASVDDADFVRWIAARASAETPLDAVRTDDLLVACACARGDGAAIAAVEAKVFPEVTRALARMRLDAAAIDDVLQGVRRTLFVGDEAAPPRIAEYTGQGELRGWLRVTAVRAALKAIRRGKREIATSDEDAVFEDRVNAVDPELLYVKARYRAEFKAAFQAALDALGDREKNLLRQHVVDELTIDEIGALYNVHRATAARWLTKAREDLLAATRRHFMDQAKVSAGECDSALRLALSQIDATIRRRLEAVAG